MASSRSSIPPIRLDEPTTRRLPERSREDARNATHPRPAVFRRVCAWCGLELARERRALSGEAEITTWGICPDCLELREGMGKVDARDRSMSAGRRSDGPGPNARKVGRIVGVTRAVDVPAEPIA
jgi:hypothetical protein